MRRFLMFIGIIAITVSLNGCPWWHGHGHGYGGRGDAMVSLIK